MRERLERLPIYILTGGISLFFASCHNFLSGMEIKKEIEGKVAYANAPAYTILIDYSKDSGIAKSPASGETSKKVSDTFPIRFDTFSDYEFLKWTIVDSTTKNEIPNGEYLSIENTGEEETSCTFTKAPEDGMQLCLVPIVVERPQILSYTPMVISGGCLKDTTIQIVFDRNMSEDSIYYTDEEKAGLMENGIPESDFLSVEAGGETRFYGYTKDGDSFFKNISIKDKSGNLNLNKHFGCPVFENENTLSIPADRSNFLPDFTKVMVILEKGFFYEFEGKSVRMAGNKKWIYQVNNGTDSTGPDVADTFSLELCGQSLSSSTLPSVQPPSSLKFIDGSSPSLSLNLSVHDDGSGPANLFSVVVDRICGPDYASSGGNVFRNGIEYQFVTEDSAQYNGISSLSTLTDGVYELRLELSDKCANPCTYPVTERYYFAVDTKAPEIAAPTLTETPDPNENNNSKMTLSWNPGSIKDLKQTDIVCREFRATNITDTGTFGRTETSGELSGLTGGSLYAFNISHTDYAGNTKTNTIYSAMTPYKVSNVRLVTIQQTGKTPGKVSLRWDAPEGRCTGYEITLPVLQGTRERPVTLEVEGENTTRYDLTQLIDIGTASNDILIKVYAVSKFPEILGADVKKCSAPVTRTLGELMHGS